MNRSGEGTYWGYIWDKFLSGDRKAFETIYHEFVDVLFAYGSRITNQKDLLEDSIQDLFLELYAHGTTLRKPGSLEFYLYKSLKRIIVRKLKEKYRFTHPENSTGEFDLTFPLEEVNADDLEEHLEILQQELKSLDSNKRELLFLKFHSGLTYNEIGLLLQCKPDTVKKQVFRILKHLQGKIKTHTMTLFAIVGIK